MPSETSIPCSKEVRDLVKSRKEYPGQSYNEFLKNVFSDEEETRS